MDEAQLWGSPVVKNQLSGFKNHFQPPAVAFRKLLIPEISVRLTRRSPCSKMSVFMLLKAEEELI